MKEVTYEDWEKNPTPRMMWVWDDDECQREKIKVIYFKKTDAVLYPVVTMSDDEQETGVYTHCAEIEEKRPCTGEELLEMLKKQGLPYLQGYKAVFNIVDVARISTSSVEMSNGDYCTYEQLCENYTLLDGTELWIKED